jgi:hypothetical protein
MTLGFRLFISPIVSSRPSLGHLGPGFSLSLMTAINQSCAGGLGPRVLRLINYAPPPRGRRHFSGVLARPRGGSPLAAHPRHYFIFLFVLFFFRFFFPFPLHPPFFFCFIFWGFKWSRYLFVFFFLFSVTRKFLGRAENRKDLFLFLFVFWGDGVGLLLLLLLLFITISLFYSVLIGRRRRRVDQKSRSTHVRLVGVSSLFSLSFGFVSLLRVVGQWRPNWSRMSRPASLTSLTSVDRVDSGSISHHRL